MMFTSLLLALQVAQASATQPIVIPEIVNRARVDAAKVVDVHAMLFPDTVYVGQQSTYQIGVFMESVTRQRMRRNPEYVAPEVRDLLAYDLRDKPRGFVREVGNRPYEVHVFRRAIFALAPGTVEIPAARLTYSLPQGGSYFSREESFTLRSESVRLTVIDPPTAGRPPEWRGAVGAYRVSSKIGSAQTKAGDPLVLTLRVEGQGNITLLPRPVVALSWGTVIPAGERVSVDSQPASLRGAKEFDWIVTPRVAGVQYIPAVRFPYFNPLTRRYEIAESVPILKQVEVGDLVAPQTPVVSVADAPSLQARLAIVRTFGGERSLPFGQSWWFKLLLLLAPFPALIAFWRTRPRKPKRPLSAYERLVQLTLHEPAIRDGAARAAALRRAFLDALRERTGLQESRLTADGAWERALCLEGVTAETARRTAEALRELDAAAFHVRPEAPAAMGERIGALFAAIDAESRGRRAGRRVAGVLPAVRRFRVARAERLVLLVACLTVALPLLAGSINLAREAFAKGVTAYDAGDFRLAAQQFADAAHEAPRSVEAWANFGTAAWAAADSAHAVVGWQRALRLAPTDVDVRARLAATRAPHDVGPARVPAVPANLPAIATLLVWLAGWALVARRRSLGRPAGLLVGLTLLFGAALMTATTRLERALMGRDLAVVIDPVALRTLPALGAEVGPVPLAGETARIDARAGVWSHVIMDESRSGWIPTQNLASLSTP